MSSWCYLLVVPSREPTIWSNCLFPHHHLSPFFFSEGLLIHTQVALPSFFAFTAHTLLNSNLNNQTIIAFPKPNPLSVDNWWFVPQCSISHVIWWGTKSWTQNPNKISQSNNLTYFPSVRAFDSEVDTWFITFNQSEPQGLFHVQSAYKFTFS